MKTNLKFYFAIIISCFSICVAAMDKREPETKRFGIALKERHNACCHWCRISKEREGSNAKAYSGCPNPNCTMTYCGREMCAGEPNPFVKGGCLVCIDKCCCAFDVCLAHEEDPTHKHCFTHKRKLKRHDQQPMKWKKKKKEFSITKQLPSEIKPEPLEIPLKRRRPRPDNDKAEGGVPLKRRRLEESMMNIKKENSPEMSKGQSHPLIESWTNIYYFCPSPDVRPKRKQSCKPVEIEEEELTPEELTKLEQEVWDFLDSYRMERALETQQ